MTAIETIKSELLELHEEASAILALAESENREMTVSEKVRVNRLHAEFEEKSTGIKLREGIAAQGELLTQGAGRKTTAEGPGPSSRQLPATPGGRIGAGQRPEHTMAFRDSHGNVIHAHAGTRPIVRPESDVSAGQFLRALLLNDYADLPATMQNAVHGGTGASGGFLLQPTVSGQIIDLARSASVCLKAGVWTLPISGDVQLTRINRDPTVHWRSELQHTASSGPVFGALTLRPKMLSCLVPVSIEMLEDSINAAAALEMAASRAMATELDRAILVGAGVSSQPLGIALTPGTNMQGAIGTISDYSEITVAVRDILTANYDGEISNLSWIQNPIIAAAYDGLQVGESDATPLKPTEWASQLRRYHTTGLAPSGSPTRHTGIVGDFTQCVLGARYAGTVVDVLDTGSVTDADDETINLVSQFARVLRLRIRVDVAVLQPAHFSVMTGIQG